MHEIGYKQLNYQKRCQILAFWKAGLTQRNIAKEIGVHESTISRELKRNITFVRTKLGSWQYKPDYAQSNANEKHKKKNKFIKFTDEAKRLFVKNFNKTGVQTKLVVMLIGRPVEVWDTHHQTRFLRGK